MQYGIRLTKVLGCKHFVIHPIMPFGTGAEPDSEMFYKLNYEFYKSLIPTAEKYGVVICVENMPFVAHSISRPVDIANFVKDLDSDYIAMCLDTGHAEVQKVKAADAVRAMKDKLVTLHVHDNDGKADQHRTPGNGNIDWEDFSNALNEIGFDGCLSFETCVSGDVPEGEERDRLERELAEMGRRIAKII
jgi:sugar phosphate isomerase/epimerase